MECVLSAVVMQNTEGTGNDPKTHFPQTVGKQCSQQNTHSVNILHSLVLRNTACLVEL